jgi:hypothetical protein
LHTTGPFPKITHRFLLCCIEETINFSNPAPGGSGMTERNPANVKLQRIQQLWVELRGTKLNSPEYQDIMKKIHALSGEYHSPVDAPRKGEKPK